MPLPKFLKRPDIHQFIYSLYVQALLAVNIFCDYLPSFIADLLTGGVDAVYCFFTFFLCPKLDEDSFLRTMSTDSREVKEGVAIVTGATAGIGMQLARQLAQLGFQIHLPVRNMSKGEAVKRMIVSKHPKASVTLYECDLTSGGDVRKFIHDFRSKATHLDLLISKHHLSSQASHSR